MKTVHMLGKGRIEVIDLPEPEPYDNYVVVKIESSTICGTDYNSYYGQNPLPSNSGHEAAGTICKTDKPSGVREGERVSIYPILYYSCHNCQPCLKGDWLHCEKPLWPDAKQKYPGNFSQYILVREDICLPLADEVSFDIGALIDDCLGTPYQAIKRLNVNESDTVLITGVGPIGSAALIISKFLNATVIATDVNEKRLERALECGVDHIINTNKESVVKKVRDITSKRGVDVAIECSGIDSAQNQCIKSVKPRGRVAFLGIKSETSRFNVIRDFILKDITVIGSWAMKPSMHYEIMDLLKRGLPAEQLITHKFGLQNAAKAFKTFFEGDGMKVMINPWD
jgi:propanol-preferring alcohol dehydrogenase